MDAFALRLVLSFLLGGATVALFTTIAERAGSRLGGLLLSFPVKVTISLVFIALTEGVAFASDAAISVPAGMGVNVVFLGATALLVQRMRPWPAMIGALAAWAVAGLAVVLWLPHSMAWSLAAWLAPTLAVLFLLRKARGDRKATTVRPFSWLDLASRAAGAGTVVALSIVIAHYAGPILGGLATVFPSGWITTMVILTRHHGPAFTAATVRVMTAGSVAPVVFGLSVALLDPEWGVLGGTVGAMGFAGVGSLTVGLGLRARDRKVLSESEVSA